MGTASSRRRSGEDPTAASWRQKLTLPRRCPKKVPLTMLLLWEEEEVEWSEEEDDDEAEEETETVSFWVEGEGCW